MNIPIRPLRDKIIAVSVAVQTMTPTGLHLTEMSTEKSYCAKIVAIGPEVKNLKIDDNVIYTNYLATNIRVGGHDYLIISEDDVLAVITS